MNLKQEVVYHLVNTGLLAAHVDPEWPKRGRLVTQDGMEEFGGKFVPLTEIARDQKICSRSAMTLFSKRGIKPIMGGDVDNCRQVFYRRLDIASFR
jgi:hypothetical protein